MTQAPIRHMLAMASGQRFGALEVERVLGQGGFAITYLVRTPDGQPRVVKECVPAGLVTRRSDGRVVPLSPPVEAAFAAALADFRKEGARLARLVQVAPHPCLPRVSDPVEANGTAWFEMPYEGAETLKDRLERTGALGRHGIEPIAAQLVDALSVLERHGVLHRDIKPENIVLRDADGTPVLIDFGAARLTADAATQLQTRIGTEHYRAPEQSAGRGPVGVWTDIYGLAATLYHALAGHPPADASARQFALLTHEADPLVRLETRADLVAEHGRSFLLAIMDGLAVRPADRPQSIAEWRARFLGQQVSGIATRPVGAGPAAASAARAGAAAQAQLRDLRYDSYLPEPEKTPWGRYLAGGLVLFLIAGAGSWLALTALSSPPGSADSSPPVETASAPPEAAEAPPPPRSADEEAWVRALEQDTLEGYRAYLAAFPNGRYASNAQAEIDRYDDAAWAEAQRRDTLAGYESYLQAFPDGRHASQARERAQAIRDAQAAAEADAAERAAREARDWADAARADTIQSYTDYLDSHPAGPNASEARIRRDRLRAQAADRAAFEQAKALNTVEAYQQYRDQFPQGAFLMEAVAAMDSLRPAPGRTFRDCNACPVMVSLPSGTAQLGAPDSDPEASPAEKPQRAVTIPRLFAMSVHEITFEDWQTCANAGACRPIASDNGWGRGRRPVINVTWEDAVSYTTWLSQRTGHRYELPSEAQWEYAARGGQSGNYPGGSAVSVCAFANGAGAESGLPWANSGCADPAPDRTLPAGSLLENGFGLRDMIGNVAEWTQDCNTLNLRDAPVDGTPDQRGSCGQRVVRGGSWFSGPADLRYTSRMMQRRGDSNDFTGFRVVRIFEP